MTINVVRFEHQQRTRWGVARGGRIVPIPGDFSTTGDLLRGTTLAELEKLDGHALESSEVTILAPVTQNQQFVCQGANYRQHMIESGMDPEVKKQRIAQILPEEAVELFFKIQSKRTQYLKPGDIVEARIRSAEGRIDLGVQRNHVVADA